MGTHPIFESDFDCLTERNCHGNRVRLEIMELKLRNVQPHQQLNISITEKHWILLDGAILIQSKLFGRFSCVIPYYGRLYFSLASKAFLLLEKLCTSQLYFLLLF